MIKYRHLVAGCLAGTLAVCASAFASDRLPTQGGPPEMPPLSTWTGFYGGLNSGVAFGEVNFSDPFGPSIFGDRVSSPGYLWGVQAGYNWQMPGSNWVFGVQADADLMSSDGANTCYAYSGSFVSARCRVQPDAIGSLTGRLGYALGPAGRTLAYVKGGGAVIDEHINITTNGAALPFATSQTTTRFGWTLGAGLEYALSSAWSVAVEYDRMGFGPFGVAAPAGLVQAIPRVDGYFLTPGFGAHATQNVDEVKVSLNYNFGGDLPGDPSIAASFLTSFVAANFLPPLSAPPPSSGWEFEFGPRYWYSVGKFQKGNSGEVFGRIESPWSVFLKGYAGIGGINRGQMNDEDWLLFGATVPYSNTVSNTTGTMNYAVLDLGYDWLRSPNFKVGSFIGYFYDHEFMRASGCAQIANPLSDCAPALPSSTLGITESDTWQALRLGAAGEVMLTDGLKLSAEASYLPYVTFDGLDHHILRSIYFPENAQGQGVQFESILSYDVTKNWNVGVGGR
jgi:opacity protein-like surface antigen